jgi:hypothetical protein
MSALHALMEGIIDYAGLFPPARLSLSETVRNYARHLAGLESWLLGRLVCPTAKFAELDALQAEVIDPSARKKPWRISALGRSGQDAVSFGSGLVEDAAAMRDLADRFDGRVVADAIETRLPDALLTGDDDSEIVDVVGAAVKAMQRALPGQDDGVSIFLEVPFVGDWAQAVERAVRAVSGVRDSMPGGAGAGTIGLKIRTGGVTADLIPSVEQVATFIDTCVAGDIPFKATAGLHHPVRHHSQEVGAKMHGFLNVFLAAVLARAGALPRPALLDILAEETVGHFRFDKNGLGWGDRTATIEQIHTARRESAISFGSCSVTEPIEDLTNLGLIADATA